MLNKDGFKLLDELCVELGQLKNLVDRPFSRLQERDKLITSSIGIDILSS
jgi:hypothetical protein